MINIYIRNQLGKMKFKNDKIIHIGGGNQGLK